MSSRIIGKQWIPMLSSIMIYLFQMLYLLSVYVSICLSSCLPLVISEEIFLILLVDTINWMCFCLSTVLVSDLLARSLSLCLSFCLFLSLSISISPIFLSAYFSQMETAGPYLSLVVVTRHDTNPSLFNTKFRLNFG